MTLPRDIMTGARVFLIFLTLVLIEKSQAFSVDIVLNDYNFQMHRENYFQFFNITDQIRNKRRSLHIEAEFVKPVEAFNAQLTLTRYNFRTTFLNVTINGCSSLAPKVKNRLFKIIANAIHYGDSVFPKKCPIPGNKRLIIDQFYLHPEDFPVLQADMRYLSNFSWVMEKKRIFTISMDFSTKKA